MTHSVHLTSHRYGKAKVRVLKAVKTPGKHEVYDINAKVLVSGNPIIPAYTTGDNSLVVPTDTIKNTCYILAEKHTFTSIEEFAIILGRHFIETYAHIEKVNVELVQNIWERIKVGGTVPHEHSFKKCLENRFTRLEVVRAPGGLKVESFKSGVNDLLILKTTGSGFEKFHTDKYTTLKDTNDRIFATSVLAEWTFSPFVYSSIANKTGDKFDYNEVFNKVVAANLDIFATEYSKSVQETLYNIGCRALDQNKILDTIHLSMPNKHAFGFDMSRFHSLGVKNTNTVFQPVEEPSGLIEGTISRQKAKL
eukprot:TRINITY_DN1265_c0_g1_i1.p1 TRINITY_DN1265_c0_g1~~TRINITY_DN1265_c0_g1_i1.p1  ORF type:complete len:308 (+),score=63.21 TRINITY_DN1265_c0_g1_i1:133-1056(+)